MIRRVMAVVGVVAALALMGNVSAQAKQPLYGDVDVQFNLAWPGPQPDVPDWVGTVTIDGVDYGFAAFNTGTGKAFAEQPADGILFFEETWVVYEDLEFSFDADGNLATFEPGAVLLSGYHRGVSVIVNATYRMNGDVRVANGPFAEYLGRQTHGWGTFEFYDFGAPYIAPGRFRIN